MVENETDNQPDAENHSLARTSTSEVGMRVFLSDSPPGFSQTRSSMNSIRLNVKHVETPGDIRSAFSDQDTLPCRNTSLVHPALPILIIDESPQYWKRLTLVGNAYNGFSDRMSSSLEQIHPPYANELDLRYEEYINLKAYDLIEKIDEDFDVWRVRHKISGELFALKMLIDKSSTSKIVYFLREMRVSQMCSHPNIVKTYATFQDESVYYILQELAEADLFSLLSSRFPDGCPADTGFYFEEAFIRQIFTQIVYAIDYLHQHKIAHRDIKPDNILLFKDGVVKLADFGWAKTIEWFGYHTPKCGTTGFRAPEAWERKPYDHRADFWSLGVVLYNLSYNYMPAHEYAGAGETSDDIITESCDYNREAGRSSELIGLIKSLLATDLGARITNCQDIYNHPWMLNNSKIVQKDGLVLSFRPRE